MGKTMNRRLRALESRIEKIKQEIAALGTLRPGSLSQQYNVCGKPDCRCKADPPQKHGPYHQLSFTWQGRSRTEFVRGVDLHAVEEQLRNYSKLRELVETWITLGIELSQLQLQKTRSTDLAPRTRKRRPATV